MPVAEERQRTKGAATAAAAGVGVGVGVAGSLGRCPDNAGALMLWCQRGSWLPLVTLETVTTLCLCLHPLDHLSYIIIINQRRKESLP